MYNSVSRCTNHIDYDATTGEFRSLFRMVLYGYFAPRHSYHPKTSNNFSDTLQFTLYFADPFDPKTEQYASEFSKDELRGFEHVQAQEQEHTIPLKNIQVNPLQYRDPHHVPTVENAFTNNSYGDARPFFKRILHNNREHINKVMENSILYRVTFDVPYDAICEYISVDKIFFFDGKEKTYNVHARGTGSYNTVENLFKKMKRTESLIGEIYEILQYMNEHKDIFVKPVATGYGADHVDRCRNFEKFNLEHSTELCKRLQDAYTTMHDVMWQARYFDFHAEPKKELDTKCSHQLCNRVREPGSQYCNRCIQLNTRECNMCGR
jgi:hypothetical protein